jgi:TPR repeat protein
MLLTGKYGEFDPEEPFRLYRQAADLGHAWALYALTLRRSEPEQQIARLAAIAESGNTEGDNWLCEIAHSGFTVENAFEHCLQAARAGYTVPRVFTALSYQQGTGVEASASRARYWARMALGGFDISEIHRNRMQTILG